MLTSKTGWHPFEHRTVHAVHKRSTECCCAACAARQAMLRALSRHSAARGARTCATISAMSSATSGAASPFLGLTCAAISFTLRPAARVSGALGE